MVVLTISDILNGKKNIQEVEIPSLDGSVKLRPLTDGEYHLVNAKVKGAGLGKITTKPVMDSAGNVDKAKTMQTLDLDLDVEEIDKIQYDAAVLVATYGLTNDDNTEIPTEEQIRAFPPNSVEEIAAKVYEISGVDNPVKTRKDVENFREE